MRSQPPMHENEVESTWNTVPCHSALIATSLVDTVDTLQVVTVVSIEDADLILVPNQQRIVADRSFQ